AVHARRGHVPAQAVDAKKRDREQNPALQLRNAKYVLKTLEHRPDQPPVLVLRSPRARRALGAGSVIVPPAASILARAVALAASTAIWNAALTSPPPKPL